MAKQRIPSTTRAAVFGLIGTMLSVCGGLTGAGVSAAVKIYEWERGKEQVDVAPPVGEQPFSIDFGDVFISRQQAAALDLELYFVDLELGLAIHRPLPGWDELERLTMAEVLSEEGTQFTPSPLTEQPVYRIRYGEPIEIQSDQHTLVNGRPLSEQELEVLEQLYGPPPWTQSYYSQIVINVFDRTVAKELRINNLPDLLLMLVSFSHGRINRLTAETGSHFMVVQSSITYENVRMAGEAAALALESWILFAETEDTYYTVEIAYTQQSDQPIQIWDDLQTYMDSLHVVQ